MERNGTLRARLRKESPRCALAKAALQRSVLEEIEKQLKNEEMVKVRILKTALAHDEAKQIAMKIAEQTAASLVEVRGHTFMLYKSDKK